MKYLFKSSFLFAALSLSPVACLMLSGCATDLPYTGTNLTAYQRCANSCAEDRNEATNKCGAGFLAALFTAAKGVDSTSQAEPLCDDAVAADQTYEACTANCNQYGGP